jgi:hypothetical protein
MPHPKPPFTSHKITHYPIVKYHDNDKGNFKVRCFETERNFSHTQADIEIDIRTVLRVPHWSGTVLR